MAENEPPEELGTRDGQGRFVGAQPTSFRAGEPSANPGGRPKEPVSLVKELRRQLRANPEHREKLIENLIKLGKGEDYRALGAIAMLLDRTDGPVKRDAEPPTLDLPPKEVRVIEPPKDSADG